MEQSTRQECDLCINSYSQKYLYQKWLTVSETGGCGQTWWSTQHGMDCKKERLFIEESIGEVTEKFTASFSGDQTAKCWTLVQKIHNGTFCISNRCFGFLFPKCDHPYREWKVQPHYCYVNRRSTKRLHRNSL